MNGVYRAALVLLMVCATPKLGRADDVSVSAPEVTKAMWVAAAQHNIANDPGAIVVASSLNAFYKTYPNATGEQAAELVDNIQNRLASVPRTEYAVGHETREELLQRMFNVVSALPVPQVKLSVAVARESIDMLRREGEALLDQQARVAAETTFDIGLRLNSDSAFVQRQLEQIYDHARLPARAAVINGKLGRQFGVSTQASIDGILAVTPSLQELQVVQYMRAHMLTADQFRDSLGNLRLEFTDVMGQLNARISDEVLPAIAQMNHLQLTTYETLRDYIESANARAQKQEQAKQERQVYELQLESARASVYLLSTVAGFADPKLGRVLNVAGSTAIQVNEALANFRVASTSVDTSVSGSAFTGAQLGSIVLTGNLVNAAMQLASAFIDSGPSPDEMILDQLAQLRREIAYLQQTMEEGFARIDSQLGRITAALDTVLDDLSLVGADVGQVQIRLFGLQSQVSQLEVEIHEWLANSDRIPLLTAINTALGYQQRTGRLPSFAEMVDYEGLLYTWSTDIARDTTRAGPDYSREIVMANQLKFPRSGNVNYLAQLVSSFLGLPRLVANGTRLAGINDYLFSAAAYLRLLRENPGFVQQFPGAPARLRGVSSVGKQLKTVLDGMNNRPLFLDATKGLVLLYQHRRDTLKAAIADHRNNTFLRVNTCTTGVFDGCIPPGVDMWWQDYRTMGGQVAPRSVVANPVMAYPGPSGTLNGCDGRALGFNYPSNNIYYAVPEALLQADARAGGNQLSLCLEPSWASCVNHTGQIKLTLRVKYRGTAVLAMSVIPPVSNNSCVFTPDPWFWVWKAAWDNWVSHPYRSYFENHANITLRMEPWAEHLPQMLQGLRAQYYHDVAAEFVKDSPIGRAAIELNTAKALNIAFIELGLPQTLRGNDYLRSLLYGNQSIYDGFDPIGGIDIKSLYDRAGTTSPEMDIVAPSEKRIGAVSIVLDQVFQQDAASHLGESNVELESIIRKLDDLAMLIDAASTATTPPDSQPPSSPTPAPTSCATPDPFVILGGGTCYNGGWLPPGIVPPGIPGSTPTPPAPPPPSNPALCATPDPFVNLGGGTCYNGGWLPPGIVPPGIPGSTPTPPAPPPPSNPALCATPDPFVNLGGGTCYNGGWLPPGIVPPGIPGSTPTPPAPPPPSNPAQCATPDPFVNLGGGTCYNGGWLPPGIVPPGIPRSTPTPPAPPPPSNPALCATPDPFVNLGGGTCYNGGWLPPGMVLPRPRLDGKRRVDGDAAHTPLVGTTSSEGKPGDRVDLISLSRRELMRQPRMADLLGSLKCPLTSSLSLFIGTI